MTENQSYICGDCKGLNSFREGKRGSGFIEALLYATLFFPGIFYSIWRRKTEKKICKYCGSEFLLPNNLENQQMLKGTAILPKNRL